MCLENLAPQNGAPRTCLVLQLVDWASMTPSLEALAEGALGFPRRDAIKIVICSEHYAFCGDALQTTWTRK